MASKWIVKEGDDTQELLKVDSDGNETNYYTDAEIKVLETLDMLWHAFVKILNETNEEDPTDENA